MRFAPFTVSLSSEIQVNTSESGYTLSRSPSDSERASTPMLSMPAGPGFGNAIAYLREGQATPDHLTQILTAREGSAAGEQFAATLQQLDERGWLHYTVLPLAVAIPMVESAGLNLDMPHWTRASASLSRFAYQRAYDGGMILESPLSKFRVKLTDWRASAILVQLAQPQLLGHVAPPPQIGPETAYQFLNLLWATGFLTVKEEAPNLKLWDFHNLLFHSRSRQGRHDYPNGDIQGSLEQWSDFPVVKPPMSEQIVALPQLNIDTIRQKDATLTTAIAKRESIREYDENRPITVEQLGELLYRTARVKEIYTVDAELTEAAKAEFGPDFDWGELSHRPYPCGGAMYELEIYPVVRRCTGLHPGFYHYNPLHHQLEKLDAPDTEIAALIADAHRSSGEQGVPQVLLVITARFGRLFRKYRSLAYALVLKHVGVLYQNFYLVATNMGLAPCALGGGDSDCFARATGLDYATESSVGEFMLGSLPNQDVPASKVKDSGVELYAQVSSVHSALTESSAMSSEATANLEMAIASGTVQNIARDAGSNSATLDDESVAVAEIEKESHLVDEKVNASVKATAIAPSAAKALHPHDLDDRIPGLADLRNQTLGDPHVTIVILDGNPDHTLSCFEGAEISKVFPYWHEPAEQIPAEAYEKYREIDNNEDLDKEEKAEALKAAFPEPILKRIHGDNHACHVTSTIVGQENTPSPGLAPHCRVINVPLNTTGTDEELISPLNLARAFELALNLGANIIHCAACRPTQTGEGEEILLQALKKCQDNNILMVAPAGNNKGECWCMPASLPGVLSVGALKPDGTPYQFSNWGGNNALEGIIAPGGDILGAQPATEEPVRQKGTSMSAPVMTGLCALLASLQLQQGKPIDAEAIRAALLNTATPCDPDVIEEPERCLRGIVNLPGATSVLFGPSVTISFTEDGATRTERPAISPAGVAPPAAALGSPDSPATTPSSSTSVAAATPTAVTPSTAHSGNVYALGTLGYDFGDEARLDTFKERMADPYDPRQMVNYLDSNPEEARSLIWTLILDGDIIYVLDPKGSFATNVYEMFLLILAGQLEPETSNDFVDRISVSARRTNRTVELFSGEVVPVVNVRQPRGMYGWNVKVLIDGALASEDLRGADEDEVREGLAAFLNRVYYDLSNLGQTSRDRALNFAATNIFQVASVFVKAIASRRQLDTIEVDKSPYCRLNSDCWDVVLTFFDPDNQQRSRQVFRFTLDVSDTTIPVTVGSIKSWSLPGKGTVA